MKVLKKLISISITLALITGTVFADGDGFILKRGTVKDSVDRPISEGDDSSESYRELIKSYDTKKASGTWNKQGIAVAAQTVSGKVVMPVTKGRVSSQFGVRSMGGTDYHKGIDISKNSGTNIVLPMDCKIIASKVGYNRGAGNYVKASSVANPNIVFIFMHMAGTPSINGTAVSKLVGKSYPAGTKVGVVGTTGASTGPHLHFQVQNTKDPMTGGVSGKFGGCVPPIHLLFGDKARETASKYITLGSTNGRKENMLMNWHKKTVESYELK